MERVVVLYVVNVDVVVVRADSEVFPARRVLHHLIPLFSILERRYLLVKVVLSTDGDLTHVVGNSNVSVDLVISDSAALLIGRQVAQGAGGDLLSLSLVFGLRLGRDGTLSDELAVGIIKGHDLVIITSG